MNKFKPLILLTCLITVFSVTNAQDFSGGGAYPQNVIKTNPFNLSFGTINLSYERMLTDYNSLNLRVRGGYSLPFKNKLDGHRYRKGDWNVLINNKPIYSSVALDLEYRFYSKKQAGPQGFYAAPYLRYNHYNTQFDVDYTGDIYNVYRTVQGDITIKPNLIGAGVQLGAQWLIRDRITIDWSFFGIGVDSYFISGKLKSADLRNDLPRMKADIDKFVNENSTLIKNKTTQSGNELTTKTRFFTPGFKTGFTIGYAF